MLVCTLPSPACMCSATQTRPRSTRCWAASTASSTGEKASPEKIWRSGSRTSIFQDTRIVRSCSRWKSCACGCSASRASALPARWPSPTASSPPRALASGSSMFSSSQRQRSRVAASSSRDWRRRSASSSSAESLSRSTSSDLPSASGPASKASSASSTFSLLRIDSSMLMRSMPSVYSPIRSSGMTTSSLILKALVWRAIAAVRARSSQKVLRASGDTATKPSPERPLAIRTTSDVALATPSSSSPTMSPISTIFGRPPRRDLVV